MITDNEAVTFKIIYLSLVVVFVITMLLGIIPFLANISNSRLSPNPSDKKYSFIQSLRDYIYFGFFLSISFIVYIEYYEGAVDSIVSLEEWVRPRISYIQSSTILCFVVVLYWRVLKIWNSEKISYYKSNFKLIRDLPLMIIGCSIIPKLITTVQLVNPAQTIGTIHSSTLSAAVYLRDEESFSKLARNESERNFINNYGWSPIMIAAYKGDYPFFKTLRSNGSSTKGFVTKGFLEGADIFILSILGNNPQIVESILDSKNAKSKLKNFSLIHFAANESSPKMIDLLIKKGADVNVISDTGNTPLHIASKRSCMACVTSLIEAGADPHIKNKEGKMPLDLSKEDEEIKYYLEKKGRIPAGK